MLQVKPCSGQLPRCSSTCEWPGKRAGQALPVAAAGRFMTWSVPHCGRQQTGSVHPHQGRRPRPPFCFQCCTASV